MLELRTADGTKLYGIGHYGRCIIEQTALLCILKLLLLPVTVK